MQGAEKFENSSKMGGMKFLEMINKQEREDAFRTARSKKSQNANESFGDLLDKPQINTDTKNSKIESDESEQL